MWFWRRLFFTFSVLTVSFGLGLDLDSNLFRLGLDSDSNLFGLGLVLDSTKVDLTTALIYIYIYIYIYIRGGTVHVLVLNRHSTDLLVRCMRPYDEYRQFTPNPALGDRSNATLFDNPQCQQKNSECRELRTWKQSPLDSDHVMILNASLTRTDKSTLVGWFYLKFDMTGYCSTKPWNVSNIHIFQDNHYLV